MERESQTQEEVAEVVEEGTEGGHPAGTIQTVVNLAGQIEAKTKTVRELLTEPGTAEAEPGSIGLRYRVLSECHGGIALWRRLQKAAEDIGKKGKP